MFVSCPPTSARGAVFFVHVTGAPVIVFAFNVVYWFFFLANLMACIMIGVANSEGRCDSWVLQLADTAGPTLPDCGGTALLPSEVTIFVNAIYFSTATLTTVGYGDVVAKTNVEKVYVITFMLISAFFMATVTGEAAAYAWVQIARVFVSWRAAARAARPPWVLTRRVV